MGAMEAAVRFPNPTKDWNPSKARLQLSSLFQFFLQYRFLQFPRPPSHDAGSAVSVNLPLRFFRFQKLLNVPDGIGRENRVRLHRHFMQAILFPKWLFDAFLSHSRCLKVVSSFVTWSFIISSPIPEPTSSVPSTQ